MDELRNLIIRCLEGIKFLDIFGYKATLYIDKKNHTHRKYCGSVASIIHFFLFLGIFSALTKHAVLDLVPPLYYANSDQLSTRRRM
jgi:hypothetical protein